MHHVAGPGLAIDIVERAAGKRHVRATPAIDSICRNVAISASGATRAQHRTTRQKEQHENAVRNGRTVNHWASLKL